LRFARSRHPLYLLDFSFILVCFGRGADRLASGFRQNEADAAPTGVVAPGRHVGLRSRFAQ
jgi:hypothetical protein